MAKDWPYARLVQKVADYGGPDAFINVIKEGAYKRGATDMKNKLILPLLLAGAGVGTVGVIAYQKIQAWLSDNKKEKLITEKEAALAEMFLKEELDTAIKVMNTEKAHDKSESDTQEENRIDS